MTQTHINIQGASLPCRVTMGALLRYRRQTGQDVSQMQQDDTTALVTLFWCCVASACNADGVEFTLSLEDFADRLEPGALAAFTAGIAEEQKKTAAEKYKARP